jgi:alpha-tubulin suppressor-like RCC1 family protein
VKDTSENRGGYSFSFSFSSIKTVKETTFLPSRLPMPENVKDVACGDNFCAVVTGTLCSFVAFIHFSLLCYNFSSGNGQLWCWGSNSAGQLGIGNTEDQTMPVPVKELGKFNSSNCDVMLIDDCITS